MPSICAAPQIGFGGGVWGWATGSSPSNSAKDAEHVGNTAASTSVEKCRLARRLRRQRSIPPTRPDSKNAKEKAICPLAASVMNAIAFGVMSISVPIASFHRIEKANWATSVFMMPGGYVCRSLSSTSEIIVRKHLMDPMGSSRSACGRTWPSASAAHGVTSMRRPGRDPG